MLSGVTKIIKENKQKFQTFLINIEKLESFFRNIKKEIKQSILSIRTKKKNGSLENPNFNMNHKIVVNKML